MAVCSSIRKCLGPAGRVVVRVLLGIMTLLGLLVIAAFLVCFFFSDVISQRLADSLREATGTPWSIEGRVMPVFIPSLGLSADNVKVMSLGSDPGSPAAPQGGGFDRHTLKIKRLRVEFDFAALLGGNVRLKSLTIVSPDLRAFFAPAAPDPGLPPAKDTANPDKTGEQPAEMDAKAAGMDANPAETPAQPAETPAQPAGMDPNSAGTGAKAEKPGMILPYNLVEIVSRARQLSQNLPLVKVYGATYEEYGADGILDFALRSGEIIMVPSGQGAEITALGQLVFPGAGINIDFHLSSLLDGDSTPATGALRARAEIAPPGSPAQVVDAFLPFELRADEQYVYMTGARFWTSPPPDAGTPPKTPPKTAAGETSASAPAFGPASPGQALTSATAGPETPDKAKTSAADFFSANIVFDLAEQACLGRLNIRRLNMPRWFRFARRLPPYIQKQLNAVSGNLCVYMDSHSAGAFELNLAAGDVKVSGSLNVRDFNNSVIVADLDLAHFDADRLFPFLALKDKAAAQPPALPDEFAFPWLIPYPDIPGAYSAPDVGYDVRLNTATLSVHGQSCENVTVRCRPEADSDVIEFSIPKFAKGGINGKVAIADDSVDMLFDFNALDLGALPEFKGTGRNPGASLNATFTGSAHIPVKVANGIWDDVLGITLKGRLDNPRLGENHTGASAGPAGTGKGLGAGKIDVKAEGKLHTNIKAGLRLELAAQLQCAGLCLAPQGQTGKGEFNINAEGVLAWPPQTNAAPGQGPSVSANISADGKFNLALGAKKIPLSGKISGSLKHAAGKTTLHDIIFNGMGSSLKGDAEISPASGTDLKLRFKLSQSPAAFMKAAGLAMPKGYAPPKAVSGSGELLAGDQGLEISQMVFQIDGSRITGNLGWKKNGLVPAPKSIAAKLWPGQNTAGKSIETGILHAKLEADTIDFDNYFVKTEKTAAPPPPTAPWNLAFLYKQEIDVKANFKTARYKGLTASNPSVALTLKNDNFSAFMGSSGFYGGSSQLTFLGRLNPATSEVVISKSRLMIKKCDLAALFHEMTNSTSYGGKFELSLETSGTLRSAADFPAALSGYWGVIIRDGLYPAFMGSRSGLRNTFSRASASGIMKNGTLLWDNFELTGAMVDMNGDGRVNLANETLDIFMNVTLAGVPTIPVRLTGSFDKTTLNVRGQAILYQTAKSTGSTVFGLVRGIFELPGRMATGVRDLFTTPPKKTRPTTRPKSPGAPVTHGGENQ